MARIFLLSPANCGGARARMILSPRATFPLVSEAVSKVVPQLDAGSLVTVPRFYADYIITEYGVARLWGKNHRQRAEEMIKIAHPDHRDDLRAAAKELWWP